MKNSKRGDLHQHWFCVAYLPFLPKKKKNKEKLKRRVLE